MKISGRSDPPLGELLSSISSITQAKERFFEALSRGDLTAARATMSALRHAPLPRRMVRAWAFYFQAILASDGHRWDVAEQCALTALRLAEESELRGRACNELGILYDHLGRWDDAISFYRIGLAAFEQINEPIYVAKLAKNLGTALIRAVEAGALPAKSLVEAAMLEHRALELFRAHKQSALEAATWNELGTVFKAQGRLADAWECYERFRAYCVATGDRLGEGQALNNLGELLHSQRQLTEAEAFFCQAQALVAGNIWEETDVRINLALTCFNRGDHIAATVAADQALTDIESLRGRLQTPATRIDFFATQQRAYAFRARLARLAGQADVVFALAERAKARTFVELLAGQRIRPRTAIPQSWLQQETALRHRLETLYDAAARDPTSFQAAIVEAEARWHELRHRIAGRDAAYGSLGQVAPLTPEVVQARLPADVALLEYYADDHELLACLVRRDTIRVFPLGITLDDLAAASFDRRGRPRGLVAEGGRLGHPWVLTRLGQVLLSSVRPYLATPRLLCIVPHGPLHHLPFASLPCGEDEQPLGRLVGAVVQAPSATVWLEYCQSRPTSDIGPRSRSGACVLGYNGDMLHHAEAEAQIVAQSLGASAQIGLAATRAALDLQAPAARYVHLACPGLFRPDQPLRSGLRLADGFLDVAETFRRIRLTAELVVLSGCETGMGHLHSGDEIIGLVRAWLYAGASGAVVSLWTVDDLSTCLLMQELYDRLATIDPALALAQAQITIAGLTSEAIYERLLRIGLGRVQAQQEITRVAALWPEPRPPRPLDHPYFWAAFVLQGGQIPHGGSSLPRGGP